MSAPCPAPTAAAIVPAFRKRRQVRLVLLRRVERAHLPRTRLPIWTRSNLSVIRPGSGAMKVIAPPRPGAPPADLARGHRGRQPSGPGCEEGDAGARAGPHAGRGEAGDRGGGPGGRAGRGVPPAATTATAATGRAERDGLAVGVDG